jgi:hypothetical protein
MVTRRLSKFATNSKLEPEFFHKIPDFSVLTIFGSDSGFGLFIAFSPYFARHHQKASKVNGNTKIWN